VGRVMDLEELGAFMRDLFPEADAPLAAFRPLDPSRPELDARDLAYLLEIKDPIDRHGSSAADVVSAVCHPDVERAREAIRSMGAIGTKPLEAAEFFRSEDKVAALPEASEPTAAPTSLIRPRSPVSDVIDRARGSRAPKASTISGPTLAGRGAHGASRAAAG